MPKTLSPIVEDSVQTTTRSPVRPGVLAMLGPAFVAAVAYVDPGNFATNISGGAEFGYLLLWVIVAANLLAMLIQNLSGKMGIVGASNVSNVPCSSSSSGPGAR